MNSLAEFAGPEQPAQALRGLHSRLAPSLSDLARPTERNVSVSTHNQALSALLFLYRHVLGVALPWLEDLKRPTRARRIPSVLTQGEVAALLGALDKEMALLGKLLYGTGMRLTEGLRLRVKDVDLKRGALVVRDGKGGKNRVVMLPRSLAAHAPISRPTPSPARSPLS